MANWIAGETATLTARIVDAEGAPFDPAALAMKIENPAGVVSTILMGDLTKADTGLYRYELPLAAAGRWYFRWESGDPVMAVAEGSINVLPSRFV